MYTQMSNSNKGITVGNGWKKWRFASLSTHCWVIWDSNLRRDETKDDSPFRQTLAGCEPILTSVLRFRGHYTNGGVAKVPWSLHQWRSR